MLSAGPTQRYFHEVILKWKMAGELVIRFWRSRHFLRGSQNTTAPLFRYSPATIEANLGNAADEYKQSENGHFAKCIECIRRDCLFLLVAQNWEARNASKGKEGKAMQSNVSIVAEGEMGRSLL